MTALAIATALSQKAGKVLPWKTVRDAIGGALNARFTEVADGSEKWPCEYHSTQAIKIRVGSSSGGGFGPGGGGGGGAKTLLAAVGYLEPSQVQDLGDKIEELLRIKAKSKVPIRFQIRVELGDGQTLPATELAAEVDQILAQISDELRLR